MIQAPPTRLPPGFAGAPGNCKISVKFGSHQQEKTQVRIIIIYCGGCIDILPKCNRDRRKILGSTSPSVFAKFIAGAMLHSR